MNHKNVPMRSPIGESDFRKIRTNVSSEGEPVFYCDKTLLIKDILDDSATILLFTRPRRFGKTLNMSTLEYFFNINEDNRALFEGLNISKHANIMDNYCRKYPVIFANFKEIKGRTYNEFIMQLKQVVYKCYKAHIYLLTSDRIGALTKESIQPYFSDNFDDQHLEQSFFRLTEALHQHHGQNVVLLIDEYDTPLQKAYMEDYFRQAIDPFRNMLTAALKDNKYLFKGVLTGITRISKESLFSGLNNLRVHDILSHKFTQYFGFTEEEVQGFCPPEHLEELRSWYNGYTFGENTTIYNPWSVLMFFDSNFALKPYWINTSDNAIIKDSLTADKMKDVGTLIEGKSIELEIDQFIVYDQLKTNKSAFFNLLFTAGYLTLAGEDKVRIPNREITFFFENVVRSWFGQAQGSTFLKELLEDFIEGKVGNLNHKLSTLLLETMSFRDTAEDNQEAFYHGFLLGLTLGLKDRYIIKSNRESGYGLYDIALYPKNPAHDPGVIMEVKFNKTATAALAQIEEKAYYVDLKAHGVKTIRTYGLAFDGKCVDVVMG